ncbi:Serine/threonine-protein kinase Nek1, partial [Irineochytrium annulatum]
MHRWVINNDAILGAGGSGSVRRCRRQYAMSGRWPHHDPKEYAAKIISFKNAGALERESALEEVRLLRSVPAHANVITFVDAFEFQDRLFIITDYCEGGDLHRYLRSLRENLDERDIWTIFSQVVSGIAHLHHLRILHRDVKTKNIFLDASKRFVKIGDLGIARRLEDRDDYARTTIGTPFCFSPEICNGKPYTWTSDVWGLGLVLYELATRSYPFEAASLRAVVQKITKTEPPAPSPSYSKVLRSTIRLLLTKDPRGRPSMSQLQRLLNAIPRPLPPPHV